MPQGTRPHQISPPTIRTANATDWTYIEHLARTFSNLLGFVPRAAIRDHIDRGDYSLLALNGDPQAFILSGGGTKRPYRLVQVAVDEALWRNGLGERLLRTALARALTRPWHDMTATVRANQDANLAFLATGGILTHVTHPNNARKVALNHYRWTNTTPATLA